MVTMLAENYFKFGIIAMKYLIVGIIACLTGCAEKADVGINNDIQAYTTGIRNAIIKEFEDIDSYHGRRCMLRLALNSDGSLDDVRSEGGDPPLCEAAIAAIKEADLPEPPNERVYNLFQNVPLDFTP